MVSIYFGCVLSCQNAMPLNNYYLFAHHSEGHKFGLYSNGWQLWFLWGSLKHLQLAEGCYPHLYIWWVATCRMVVCLAWLPASSRAIWAHLQGTSHRKRKRSCLYTSALGTLAVVSLARASRRDRQISGFGETASSHLQGDWKTTLHKVWPWEVEDFLP